MEITIKRFDKALPLPAYDGEAACFDLYCRETTTVHGQEVKLLPVNIAVEVPKGSVLLVFARSSTPWKKGLMLANSVGAVLTGMPSVRLTGRGSSTESSSRSEGWCKRPP